MNKLYLNNFKGFQEQLIEFGNVNFLVGENSTGKTTLLNIINVLSTQDFWFKGDINGTDIQFGYFEEILSKHSSSKTFQVGIEKIKESDDKELESTRILLEFVSYKLKPKLHFVKFSVGDVQISYKLGSNKLHYKYAIKKIENFNEWVNYEVSGSGGNMPFYTRSIPLMLSFHFLVNKIKDKHKIDINYELLDVIFYNNYTALAPIRAKAKRIYESYESKFSPEGEHIPALLRTLLRDNKTKKKNIEILEKFGRDSNLFDSLEVRDFGSKNISPFEINIKYNGFPIKLPNVGYGVSQVLPLIIEMLSTRNNLFSIQQPEVHLHPKAQAAFGSFIYKSCINDGHGLFIETHSDYTINRFRYCMSENPGDKVDTQILFFERTIEGNKINKIGIGANGEYVDSVPDQYTTFFIDEELKLLEL